MHCLHHALVVCRALVRDCFPGTVIMLVLPKDDLEGAPVQRHMLQAGPASGSALLDTETLLLEELPSVAEACGQGCVLFRAGITPINAE
jgi:hypothetical protein